MERHGGSTDAAEFCGFGALRQFRPQQRAVLAVAQFAQNRVVPELFAQCGFSAFGGGEAFEEQCQGEPPLCVPGSHT